METERSKLVLTQSPAGTRPALRPVAEAGRDGGKVSGEWPPRLESPAGTRPALRAVAEPGRDGELRIQMKEPAFGPVLSFGGATQT